MLSSDVKARTLVSFLKRLKRRVESRAAELVEGKHFNTSGLCKPLSVEQLSRLVGVLRGRQDELPIRELKIAPRQRIG